MSIVDFNTSIWRDKWFRNLTPIAKMLFIYLWTNDDKGRAGMYKFDSSLAAYFTGMTESKILDTLSILYPKVKYDKDQEVIWIVKFVKHQFMRTPKISPKIVSAIEKDICLLPQGHPFIKEFLNVYNMLAYSDCFVENTLSIPYQYCSSEGKGEEEGSFLEKDISIDMTKFDDFWKLYPKKVDKKKTSEKWTKLNPDKELFEKIIEALKQHKLSEQWTKDNGKFIKGPAAWLNGEKWEDVLTPAKPDKDDWRNGPNG